MEQKALTLVEIMLVMIILGIIAAITVPTIINNYQNRTLSTRARKIYSNLENGIAEYMVENNAVGDLSKTALYISSNNTPKVTDLDNFFMNYFRINKKISNSFSSYGYKCINGKSYNYFGFKNCISNYEFNTGEDVCVMPNTYRGRNDRVLDLVIDTNGYKNKPNIAGKDLFIFGVNSKGILIAGSTYSGLLSSNNVEYCKKKCMTGNGGNSDGGAEYHCARYLQLSDFKINY